MAAGLAISRASVEGPDGSLYAKASVLVRSNQLTVKLRGHDDPAVFDAEVMSVVANSRSSWTVTTSRGAYTIVRDKDCGCGR